jgi:hypothetical protein
MIFTKQQFEKIVMPICAASESKRCDGYTNALQKARVVAALDSEEFAIISLFENLTSYYLRLDSPGEVLGPMLVMDGKRSAIPADLTKEQCEYLAELLPTISDPELRSRIADTLWQLKHGQATIYAAEAVKAYIEAACETDEDGSGFKANYYDRALRIYATMKRADKDGEIGIIVSEKLLKAVKKSVESGDCYLTRTYAAVAF